MCIGANSNNLLLFGITGSNGTGTGIFIKENGSYTNIDQDTILSSNVEYDFEYTYFDGVQTLKVNNHTFTVTNSNIIGRSYVYYDGAGTTGRLSELIITPL